MNKTIDQLLAMRVFIRIVETGSFVKAADSLNMPKPTVTKLVQNLERHLGAKLLQRTTRKVTVTPEGLQYFEQAQGFLAGLEAFDSRIRSRTATPKGKLRVETSSALANLVLIPALPDFYRHYPDIQIELGVSDRTVDLVALGADCAIRGGQLPDSSLVGRHLAYFDFVTCASPAYLEKYGIPTHPSEVEMEHQTVLYFSAFNNRYRELEFHQNDQHIVIKKPPIIAVNESSAHISALASGLGIGQNPRFIMQSYLDRGLLLTVLDDWQTKRQPIQIVYPSSRYVSSRLRVFLDWVVEVFAEIDGGGGELYPR